MSENKKYYYMKLKDNFFDSEEMKILESMPSGIEYQNLYLKMCLLSLKSNGALLFKDVMPYDMQMLSTVTRIKIDVVKNAIELFQKIGLVSIVDSETIYMSDIQSLVGRSSTEADRIANYRERTKSVQMYENSTPEIELDIRVRDRVKERDIGHKAQTHRFSKPTLIQVQEYCTERNNTVNPQRFIDFYESKGWLVGKTKMKDWKAAIRNWESNDNQKKQGGYTKTACLEFKDD
jgi:predicted phage replisome organizer